MRHMLVRLIPLLVVGGFLALPNEASARRRGFALITHGDTVKHVGEVTADLKAEVREETKTETDAGFEAAVEHLVSRGIGRDEAEQNLLMLIALLSD